MNCHCTHKSEQHGTKQVTLERGRVADVPRGCLAPGCACVNFVEKKEALRATMNRVDISEGEREFALVRYRRLRNVRSQLDKDMREMRERYGFRDEDRP